MFKQTTGRLARVLLLLAACMANPAVAEPTGGKIEFAQALDDSGNPKGQQCYIEVVYDPSNPGKGTDYSFRDSDIKCNNDVHSFFRVDNLPSAVLITLTPDATTSECKTDPRWSFKMRTFRQRTTTGWVSMVSLKNKLDKEIIDSGGLRMEQKKYDNGSGNIEGKLSCVNINY
ncbi:hypothetical protein [Pseudomonas putida]